MATGDSEIVRYLSTNVHHMIVTGKKKKKTIKQRWVVFQGNSSTNLYQMKIFKNDTERVLKTSYTVTRENFVGTERGEIRKGNNGQSCYFAILLKDDTILFHRDINEDPSESEEQVDLFSKWESALGDIFENDSWTVYPRRGLQTSELKVVLYCTRYSVSFGTLNPPKCFCQYLSKDMADCRVDGDFLVIEMADETQGSIEVKCERWDTSEIKQAVKKSISGESDQGGRRSGTYSEERYTLSPTTLEELVNCQPILSGV